MSTPTPLLSALRLASRRTATSLRPVLQQRRALASVTSQHNFPIRAPAAPVPIPSYTHRAFASSSGRSPADEIAERLQQMYAETKDEFEIAVESTEANAVYAQDDRDVTREELDKLKKAWEEAIEGEGEVQTELKGRAFAQRIKELENAVIALEQKATEEA
ncbi:hypothetical protein V495_07318 [Pseudogymnoascus sp. VKM F-4514 (FW-929)]|nr:hypothetical protein V495_07318 [Pseudogymnoascus sp. VKM F-4514 (FW-929)]KFY66221.1 hypothetical protein V497_01063 [Pseudogymnoascus sp. VKM F-4516 (FW-969)]